MTERDIEWVSKQDAYEMGVSTGEWMERERIIALIDGCPRADGERWHVENAMCCEGRCDFSVADYQDRIIALIKGEN